MKEKKEIKIKLSTVVYLFIIFALVIALGVVYYFGFVVDEKEKIDNNKVENEVSSVQKPVEDETTENKVEQEKDNKNNESNVKLGKFIVNGIVVQPESDGIISISIEEDNQFTAETSYTSTYIGKYEINGDKLICTSLKEGNGESGTGEIKYKESNIVFEFEIIKEDKLKFVNVSDKNLKVTLDKNYIEEKSNQEEKDDAKKIIGNWSPYSAEKNGKEIELQEIYGSSLSLGGYLTFNKDGIYTEYIGAHSEESESELQGAYAVSENEINILTNSGSRKIYQYEEKTGYIIEQITEDISVAFKKVTN